MSPTFEFNRSRSLHICLSFFGAPHLEYFFSYPFLLCLLAFHFFSVRYNGADGTKRGIVGIPEKGKAQLGKVAVLGVVDFNNTPRVLSASDLAAIDHDLLLASDQGEGEKGSQFAVLINGLLVILFGVVGEVVDWDVVVFNVLHDLFDIR